MQPLELLFRFAQEARIADSVPVGISVELLQPDIDAYLRASRDMFHFALCLHTKLRVVAISPFHQTHTLDLLERKGCYTLFLVPDQSESANATTIREDDVLAVRIEFPTRLLVFHRAVIVLKAGIALLASFLFTAVVIEPRDSRPRSISSHLTGLGVK